ncbi:MAG: FAD-dependent monooxygenase [Burkholderiales bacterium]|jgi:2-octaprenyl-6-methoxyphenol hydroxylase|nr:FAD-dependent monooxygenase [Burkholderiales bacterium]
MPELADNESAGNVAADIVIVGGGPVGSALALALRDCGLRIVLLEARAAGNGDARPLALSYGSRLILERLGVWPALAATATPIRNIHVSQRGGFGRVALAAAEAGFPELGYVVDHGRVAQALTQAVAATSVQCQTGARVMATHGGDPARVEYEWADERRELTASLVAIADGGTSGAENTKTIDYQQCAVTARVVSERPHNNIAYERFTTHGPLALLPDGDAWALVWTTTPDHAQQLCAMVPENFLMELRAAFGGRTGGFTAVTGRAAYPLRRRRAQPSADHIVLIGNAAQTLHPVAGQGFNLGLRDAWELGEQIVASNPDTLGSRAWLDAYQKHRRVDRSAGLGFTHALVELFSNDLLPLRLARGTGLALLGCMPPLKNFLVRRMTFGVRG